MTAAITSTKNEYVKFARGLKTKKARRESGCFLVEGDKCVKELLEYMPNCARSVLVSDERYMELAQSFMAIGTDVYEVNDSIMESICESKTPQGIAAVAEIPAYNPVYSGFILMLDDVSDPQNVGTMIRTADAAGCSCLVLSEESADCYSPKAVRASMGSIFHIPVVRARLADYIKALSGEGYAVAAADLAGKTEFTLDWRKTCLIIGNESRGVSEQIVKLSTCLLKIPMYGKAESLNAAVAAGILIYKIRS